ncbi:MAG TPA: L,D-transpeptidase [Actinomycetota bacterium]|jgi:lipoprotein-anchoring transpeptidase ErfK/SrfK
MKARRPLATAIFSAAVLPTAVLLAALATGTIAASLFPGAGSGHPRVTHREPAVDATGGRGSFVTQDPTKACDRPTTIGTVAAHQVVARAKPRASARPIARFPRRNAIGAPQVFDLLGRVDTRRHGVWFRALLPLRPNGTTGYLPQRTLRLSQTRYHVTISRRSFRLTLWEGCRRLKSFPIGVGTGKTPTPVGRFYLIGLLKPPDSHSIYGSYAYGLSAYSDVIKDWRGGGIIGLHGTNDQSSIGRRSSHGCIRMRNRDIEALVKILPLGTPVEIT